MKKNINLFYIINFLQTFTFTTAIWTFFFTSYLTFSFWQALFLMTIVWIISAIFEVPSWAWADRFWRKKMYLLWNLFLVINLLFWVFSTSFFSFVIAWIFCWMWYAITSWNLEALIHDWLEENKNEKEFKNISSNSYIYIFLWRAFSASISGLLFVFHPLFPVYLTLLSVILIIIFSIFLNEPKQIISIHKDNLSHFKETVHYLSNNKIILVFIFIIWILSWIWNIYWYTQQLYFKDLWFSIEFIWITFTIWALFSALWSYIFKNISNYLNAKKILNIMFFLIFLASILFSLFTKIWAIFWLIINSIMFWFVMSFWNNFLIEKSLKNQKSTLLSIFSFAITIWYSFFNILISLFIWNIWLNNVYYISYILILILFLFSLLTFNRAKI